ncbi:response regulator [Sporosarcina sp. BP05]|uniref:response regulator n=1 Tax=Sporosarcina sp. BP05 TaxID=2758726 RepID=UPI00351CA6F3
MIRVLIIEDDFRIAEINRQFVDRVTGFMALEVVKTGEDALAYLRNNSTGGPHLILLDVYIPDTEGLGLFWQLRKEFNEIDVIMVTAAREVGTITEALRGGIFDYIVKPSDFARFEQTLIRFRDQRAFLMSKEELGQDEIDRLTGLQTVSGSRTVSEEILPKGIDQITLDKINAALQTGGKSGMTAMEAGNKVGVSRSTARRYLEYLVSVKKAGAQLNYGDIGRPERKYTPWTK